ncbi:hypothetical protein M427DRAFT_55083 [Gonapodya prolifera JEL478]|uniref:Fatty acid hydroxylase domain-containing protein n=1 Tax=Gonapodya prolifera (strain JEL478) TaxID=1344416 RepID=A0A139AKX5_GONPJ|nr:hypothetical protein M427DRAFT_55083 [Gonapodya prolifera JEL478]|eukprot:KXS17075.1 hypothetical protein M427DRAFT_55083 [Gonapodya prolifera JEL478]
MPILSTLSEVSTPILSALSEASTAVLGAYIAIGSSWTSFATSFLDALTPLTGEAMAKCIVHTTSSTVVFHATFWPGFLLFRYIDRNDLLPQYKLHPGKYEKPDLNDRVWDGLTSAQAPFRGYARGMLAFFLFFYGRQNITAVPTLGKLLYNHAVAYVLNDIFFYTLHRSLHEVPSWYKLYHKQHHEFKVTNVGATSWNNWEESFGIMVCGNLASMLTGMTLFEHMLWIAMGTVYDAQVHIGYRLPYNPLNYISPPEWHDFHHYKNVGNYSAGTPIWDRLLGTDKHWRKYVARQAELKAKGDATDDGPTTLDPFEAGFKVDE